MTAPFWAFFGGMSVLRGAFEGAGKTKVAMALELLSHWVLRIPIVLVLAFTWTLTIPGVGLTIDAGWIDLGVTGVWLSFSIGAFVTFIVAVIWFRRGTWRDGVLDDGSADGNARSGSGGGRDEEATAAED